MNYGSLVWAAKIKPDIGFLKYRKPVPGLLLAMMKSAMHQFPQKFTIIMGIMKNSFIPAELLQLSQIRIVGHQRL